LLEKVPEQPNKVPEQPNKVPEQPNKELESDKLLEPNNVPETE
jgi:hypothetical protein